MPTALRPVFLLASLAALPAFAAENAEPAYRRLEFETLTHSSPFSATRNQPGASGGRLLVFSSKHSGDTLRFVTDRPPPGRYHISLVHRAQPGGGLARLRLDDQDVGAPVSFARPADEAFATTSLGQVEIAEGGALTLTFINADDPDSTTPRQFAIDFLDLVSVGDDMLIDKAASGPGDTAVFTAPEVAAGTYRVLLRLRCAPNGAQARLTAAGSAMAGAPLEFYRGGGIASVERLYTDVYLPAGPCDFRFTVTGRAITSSGYQVAVESIELIPQ